MGSEVVAKSQEKTTQKFRNRRQGITGWKWQVNASDLRFQAMAIAGEKKYFEVFLKDWKVCKENGVLKGLDLA